MGRLSRGVILYGLTGALSRTATLLLVPVLTTYLSTAQHGVLSLITVITALLTPVLSLGLGAAAGACYFQDTSERHRAATIWTALVMILPGAALMVAGAILFPGSISTMMFDTTEFAGALRTSMFATACALLALPFTMYLQFEERSGAYAVVMLGSTAITAAVTVVAVVWMRLDLHGVVLASLAGQAALLVIVLVVVASRLPRYLSRPVFRDLLRLGLPLVPGFGFVLLLQHGNKFLLEQISGLGALGIYSLGFNLGFAFSIVVAAFQTAWLPFAMSFADRREEAGVVFGRVLTYYVVGGGLLTVMFFAWARLVVLLLARPNFADAYQVVGMSAAAQFFSGVSAILLPAVYFARQVQYVTLVHAIAATVMFALSLVLIRPFGILGAGVALAAAAAASSALQHGWNVARRKAYLQVHYEWQRVGLVLLVYGALAALTLWPRNIPVSAELLFGSAVSALAILCAFVLLTPREREAVRVAIRTRFPPRGAEAAA